MTLPYRAAGEGRAIVLLDNGVLNMLMDGKLESLKTAGYVRYFHRSGAALYYLATKSVLDLAGCAIGIIDLGSGRGASLELDLDLNRDRILRLQGSGDAVYILAAIAGRTTLIRADVNKKILEQRTGMLDFYLAGGAPALIMSGPDGPLLSFRGRTMPLTIRGEVHIQEIRDERIAFIGNGSETEIIDLLLFKNLYAYSSRARFMLPDTYNLMIDAADADAASPNQHTVFFKLFINGKEAGRTGSGLPALAKIFTVRLRPNRQYLIQAERWELNPNKKRYLRANNIIQPKPFRLFVPAHRVIRLSYVFDGKKYRCTVRPLYAEELKD